MKAIRKLAAKHGDKIASLSLDVATMPTICRYIVHQPEIPKGLERLKKNGKGRLKV